MHNFIFSLFYSNNHCFKLFSFNHILILLTICVIVFLMIKNTKFIRNKRINLFIRIILLTMLFIQQILNYLWYYMNNNLSYFDALPLYPCRISEILSIILLIKWNKKIADILYYVGLTGATLALLFPDTSNLGFPNAMFIQFFLGHICIIVTIFFISITQKYIPDKNSLLTSYKYSLCYISIIIFINNILKSNYSYLRVPPPSISGLLPSYPICTLIIILFMFSLFGLIHFFITIILNANKK